MRRFVRALWRWFVRVVLRRRPPVVAAVEPLEPDPWTEQRTRPGLWVAIADALRRGG